jgi:hypothetical protein
MVLCEEVSCTDAVANIRGDNANLVYNEYEVYTSFCHCIFLHSALICFIIQCPQVPWHLRFIPPKFKLGLLVWVGMGSVIMCQLGAFEVFIIYNTHFGILLK